MSQVIQLDDILEKYDVHPGTMEILELGCRLVKAHLVLSFRDVELETASMKKEPVDAANY